MSTEISPGGAVVTDSRSVSNITTTVNTVVKVFDWNTKFLRTKLLRFSAADNSLKITVSGSLDNGATFPETLEAEFTLTTATPILKRYTDYWTAIKVEVRPAVNGAHGTLTTQAVGSSL